MTKLPGEVTYRKFKPNDIIINKEGGEIGLVLKCDTHYWVYWIKSGYGAEGVMRHSIDLYDEIYSKMV